MRAWESVVAVSVVGVCTVLLCYMYVVSMFQERNKHSYGILCCPPLTMAHNLFYDVSVETLYIDYTIILWGTQ